MPLVASRSSVRVVWIGAFVLIAGIAAALALLGSWAEDRVRASLEARTSVERLHRALVEAERSQRAYILTRDPEYLADYGEARAKLDGLAQTVRDVVARNGIESEAVDRLFSLVEERNEQLQAALAAMRRDGLEAAVETLRANEIRQTTQRIFDIVAGIDEEENRILAERERQVRFLRALLLVALLGSALGALAMTGASLLAEARMADRLAASNRELEARVRERTQELEQERRRVEHILADLSHRVGNNLSMISSFLLLEAMKATDEGVRRALEDAHQRISGIASAQRRLELESGAGTVDAGAYLGALAGDIRETVLRSDVVLQVASEPVTLRGADAVALGIVVNELVTNALKYAFPDGGGAIRIGLQERNGTVVLDVADDGRGCPAETDAGLGSLIVRSMVGALGGRCARTTARADPQRPGTRWLVQFPHRGGPARPAELTVRA